MAEGIVIDGIYITEIYRKSTPKGVVIKCKYVENGVEKTLKDNQKAISRFYEILEKLKFIGIRNLAFPEWFIKRIIITGAKFKWKDEELKECKLLGLYKAPHSSASIDINFYSWIYKATSELGYTEEDIQLLNEFQEQAILYAKGVREQISLIDIENKAFLSKHDVMKSEENEQ
nr:MAG: hypothetical protein [Bacteriophage sp.]